MRELINILYIQNAIKLAGTSQAKIARKAGRSRAMVSMVIQGKIKSAPMEKAINEAVGRNVFTMEESPTKEGGRGEGWMPL